jgi:hypothetical protein
MSHTAKSAASSFTHVAYFFIKTAVRKGRIYGYWKDGGRARPQEDGNFFSKIDMVPQGGWDGRIQFVKTGEPPPMDQVEPQRPPGSDDEDDAGDI